VSTEEVSIEYLTSWPAQ